MLAMTSALVWQGLVAAFQAFGLAGTTAGMVASQDPVRCLPAGPELEIAGTADKSMGVFGEVLKSRERCRYLIFGGNALRHDRLPGRFECRPGQHLSLALGPRGLRQGHLRSGNARGLEAGVQLAPHRVIPAASLEQLAVGAYEEVKPVVGRMAAPPIEISVLDEENTPRPDTGPHAAKQSDGLTQVLKQEPAVHDIVAAGLIPVPHVQ
jgi:hypothetical protein